MRPQGRFDYALHSRLFFFRTNSLLLSFLFYVDTARCKERNGNISLPILIEKTVEKNESFRYNFIMKNTRLYAKTMEEQYGKYPKTGI